MIPVRWTEPARADLHKIDAWLTNEASRQQALLTLTEIMRRVDFLRNFPHGGRPMLKHDFRVLRVIGTPYLIIYRFVDGAVDILRLRHEREDWQLEP